MTRGPLLFLDIDGVLIPFGGRDHRTYPPPPAEAAGPLLARADPALGVQLLDLGCELVWATTWGAEANATVAPRLGLPPLAVLDEPEHDGPPGLHWKTRPILAHAAGQPFVWVDDEIGAADRRWVAAHHPGPALLHAVDPVRGLCAQDLAAIRSAILTWPPR
ncbi:hypothetical protein ABH931_005351 [Streptacidiphilus sp. MAP12-33]|uniref:HAD domain-containing protein n=1 Tax=Streptacidiphilus sp. MAP12-33 TaxID=3156266 RepID=UPI0035118BBC